MWSDEWANSGHLAGSIDSSDLPADSTCFQLLEAGNHFPGPGSEMIAVPVLSFTMYKSNSREIKSREQE